MTKPTGVAEPLEPRASAYYLWQVPGKRVSVHLSLDVVERLEREVIESFKAVTKRGSEIGGLLLGKAGVAGQPTVIVEDFECVPCDYARGPLYRLADEDKARLSAAIQRVRASPEKGLSLVGFFRGNTRKDLALDEDDQALLGEYFTEPSNVCLLVKPFSMKPSLAGFFIWEEGRVQGEASYLQFPFKPSELAKPEFAKSIVSGAQVTVSAAPPAAPSRVDGAPAPVAPKPEARAPMPPAIPKQEEPAPPPPVAPKPEARVPAPPAIPKQEEPAPPRREARTSILSVVPKGEVLAPPPVTPKPEARAPVTPAPPGREELAPPAPAAKPEVRRPAEPVAARREAPPPAAPVEKREEAAAEAPAAERKPRKRAYLIAAAFVLVLVAFGASLYFRPGSQSGSGAVAGPDASSLALRVERNAGQLLLSWNREASLVKSARQAVLSISDGDHKEDVVLDLGQLRGGSIVYSPITNDVSFRLEVTDGEGQRRSESVRVIAGRPSPAPPVGQAASAKPESAASEAGPRQESAAPAQTAGRSQETAPAPSPTPGGGAEPPAPASAKLVAQTATPPRADSLAGRLSAAANLPEPPSLESQPLTAAVKPTESQSVPPPVSAQPPKPAPQQTTQAPAQQPPAPTPSVAAPAPSVAAPAPSVAAPASQAPAPSDPVRVGGNVQQATVIRQVDPVYPPLARQARVSGVVRVEATIGRDGRITNARAISGPPLLRQAAADAVRQWVYRPAMLNGQPVEVVTQVDITFNLGR